MTRFILAIVLMFTLMGTPFASVEAQVAPTNPTDEEQELAALEAELIALMQQLVRTLQDEVISRGGVPVVPIAADVPVVESVVTATTTVATTATTTTETESKPRKSGGGGSSTPKNQEPRYDLPPHGEAADLSISSFSLGGEDGEEDENAPKFVSAVIDPLHVYVGETQTFTVTVEALEPVTSVVATTELDNETVELPLTQISSSGNRSTWRTSWEVYDTHVRTYYTTFAAETQSGHENEITLAWSDPCSGANHGINSTLSGNCSVSAVDGLDGGNLTIPEGVTLTLNNGATWAWNPGTSITVNGAIVTSGNAQLRKGYLFYSGSTNDSANITSMVFNTSSSLASHVRAGTFFRFGSDSNAELNSPYSSGTVTIRGIANGTSMSFSRSGTTAATYSKNGAGSVTIPSGGTSTTLNNGDTIAVTVSTQNGFQLSSSVIATIGGVSSTYTVTTKADPGGPGCGGIGQDPCP